MSSALPKSGTTRLIGLVIVFLGAALLIMVVRTCRQVLHSPPSPVLPQVPAPRQMP